MTWLSHEEDSVVDLEPESSELGRKYMPFLMTQFIISVKHEKVIEEYEELL